MHLSPLKDSFKDFKDGVIGKVISSEATCARAFSALHSASAPILAECSFMPSPSGIPQYRAYGAPAFWRTTGAEGANGKGHTLQQAQASALMEMVERYSCFKLMHAKQDVRYEPADRLEQRHPMLEELSAIRKPRTAAMPDGDQRRQTPILWYLGATLRGEPYCLPLAIQLHLEGTNGMTAGNSMEEAVLHGVCEVIERHCLGLVTIANLATPRIDPATVQNPVLTAFIARLQKPSGHKLVLRDFSLGLGLPVIGVLRTVNEEQCLITAGVATHPDEALARALTESSQGDNPQDDCHRSEVARCFEDGVQVAYSTLPDISRDNLREELETLDGLLRGRGMEAAFADTTAPELGIPSAYVFINGARHLDRNVANHNLFSALLSQAVFPSDVKTVGQSLEFSDGDAVNEPFYELCRGANDRCQGAYGQAAMHYAAVVEGSGAGLPVVEAGLLRITALAHLAVCSQADGCPDKAIAAQQRLYSEQPSYDFQYLQLHYPAGFEPLEEIRRDFEKMRKLEQLMNQLAVENRDLSVPSV